MSSLLFRDNSDELSSIVSPVIISNRGAGYLKIKEITFSINDGSFIFAPGSTCTQDMTLSPNGSCIVNLIYSPQTTGSVAAIMKIHSNDPHNPYRNVQLNGTSYLLNLTFLGDCTGSVEVSSSSDAASCSDDCILRNSLNTLLFFQQTPDPYCVFNGWGGVCAGAYCHLQNNKNAAISATFIRAKAQLNQTNNNSWYATVAEALSRVYSNGEMLIQSGLMKEALNINTDKAITLKGGFDATFSNIVGETIIGSLVVSQGKIIT